ncbi:hypothetical protein B0H12DRAFT_218764 [Mycena haematopus]|nr:hypothetical protein B0H12DRAFT_218764 [Mycena haematopus]
MGANEHTRSARRVGALALDVDVIKRTPTHTFVDCPRSPFTSRPRARHLLFHLFLHLLLHTGGPTRKVRPGKERRRSRRRTHAQRRRFFRIPLLTSRHANTDGSSPTLTTGGRGFYPTWLQASTRSPDRPLCLAPTRASPPLLPSKTATQSASRDTSPVSLLYTLSLSFFYYTIHPRPTDLQYTLPTRRARPSTVHRGLRMSISSGLHTYQRSPFQRLAGAVGIIRLRVSLPSDTIRYGVCDLPVSSRRFVTIHGHCYSQ